MVLRSPRSLAATISMSAPDACTARKKLRPMRPKPLMPTRTVTGRSPRQKSRSRRRVNDVTSTLSPARRAVEPARPAYVRVTGLRPARRPACPGSGWPRCRGCRGPARACRPSRAAGGSGRRSRPWSAAGRAAGRAPRGEACLCSSRRSPAIFRWSGTSSPRISSARSTRAPAATAARAERRRLASSKFASRLAVARTSRRIRRSSQAISDSWAPSRVSSGADRVAVADHDAVDAADLAGLGLDAEPAGGTDEREGRLRAGAGHLERRGAAGLGERAVRQERAAPGGHRVAAGAGDDLRRQPAHRTAAAVEQAGLAGERLAVADHADDVPAALADAVAGDHRRRRRGGRRSRRCPGAAGGRRRRCRARPPRRCGR